ncbi:hypothetical protein Nepgr_029870 [Nepenthes gracilis]|uniref:Uncharacterized protein n=1 Tax=Nepenthes gracilis TaxID=150966 RepID=A0AAD3TEQ8_NEPGR|nr:hypothetical protein Nepgr_029870 [Nepenthes gracilis]
MIPSITLARGFSDCTSRPPLRVSLVKNSSNLILSPEFGLLDDASSASGRKHCRRDHRMSKQVEEEGWEGSPSSGEYASDLVL